MVDMTISNRFDAAHQRACSLWLHHPVIGDPSFDTFERAACNPIHSGYPRFEWPVNDFLLRDPHTGDFLAYITEYPRGYWPGSDGTYIREAGYRSRDNGQTWESLGALMEPSAELYEGDGQTPGGATGDFHVLYADGRYHVIFGWCDRPNRDGGEGYAWANDPAGPFQRAPQPIYSEMHSPHPNEKLHRLYAAGVFRRQRDWLLLAMMSTPGNAGGYWALVGAVAQAPEGPYSLPFLLLSPDSLVFHHPLMEFFPYFQHEGFLYATATSVARNRCYQGVWRAPVEQAHLPDAWEFLRDGSVWSWHPSEYEAQGIWGQTFSSVVLEDGTQLALYPSKTSDDRGTINLAQGRWMEQREQGFRLSAPNAPALSFLMQRYTHFDLETRLKFDGQGALLLGHDGLICSDRNTADAAPHARMMDNVTLLRFWKEGAALEQNRRGASQVLAQCPADAQLARGEVTLQVSSRPDGLRAWVNGVILYEGPAETAGLTGLWAGAGSYVDVLSYLIEGEARPALLTALSFEGLLGSAAFPNTFEAFTHPLLRYGDGHLLTIPGARAKWNYYGQGAALWSPRGPALGQARVWVDGQERGIVDFSASQEMPSSPCFEVDLPAGYHAVTIECISGRVPVDCLCYWR